MITREKAYQLRALIEKAAIGLTDEEALSGIQLFPKWVTDKWYEAEERIRYEETLYRCVIAHTSQTSWTPDITPALWTPVSIDEWPEWVRPTGVQDAYNIGDKVTYNEKHYICTIDGNVWSPDEYPQGWNEQ